MVRSPRSLAAALLAALAIAAAPTARAADAYPSRPITMIVPFGAGGGTDVIARAVSDELSRALNQAIVVDARPGANGAIGSAVVARAAPDGYTLLFTAQSTYSLNPNLMKEPLFDQLKDLVPVATIGRSPWLIAVPADSPFKSIAEVVAYGKANPGKLVFPFWQSSVLVTGATFAEASGIQTRKVPYKGQVEATTDFLGGRIPIMVTDVAGGRGPVESGKMRLLASTTAQRSASFPEVPTLREQGYDVVTDSMLAVFAPAGTPQPILDKLNADLSKIILTSEKVRDRLRQLGLDPTAMTQAEAEAFVRSELTRWEGMIRRAGLQKE
ncbi:MAG: tripartite tricarboxylate transporter substrate binding protein [Microvirga sp.]